ncbi:MAG TPA: AbrB/MazE/SpoVT family DNA-binding domain-containing protein [Candidatus Thermoplasmatota archaeon]|nr:AbrB/MazE/SpoVT family DNA-binding domain-containing protein [Candidatus Thermoplasmatota archaeon]
METTTIASAQSKNRSLRTTIPASIVRQFNLQAGDELTWDLQPQDNQLVLVVSPVK